MTKYQILGAALVLSVIVAAPASAQPVIDEPGAFAFYHPNADVLNPGSPRPAESMASLRMSAKIRHVNRAPATKR